MTLRASIAVVLAVTSVSLATDAKDLILPGQYQLHTRIRMPNMDENLRADATAHSECLARLDDFFPILLQPAFKGCHLSASDSGGYELVCGSGGASGIAELTYRGARWHGRLKVKMGGKNMTFSQSVSARYTGSCSDDAGPRSAL